MQIHKTCAIAITMSLAFSAGAVPVMSNDQYRSAKRVLAAEYDASRTACRPLPGRPVALCKAEANREYQIAKAGLEASYKPSRDGSYKSRVAIANAEYWVSRRKCDGKVGTVKSLCIKGASAVLIADKADADGSEDASIATRAVHEKANAARRAMREEEERAEARKDTAAERRDTDLRIAKENCETVPGEGRRACVKEAEKRFGRL